MSNEAHAQHLDGNHDTEGALKKIQTAGSISISPELFEKIYLSPQNQVKGELRKTVANPTPVCLVGFLLSLTPLSMDLMNFRGSLSGNGAASTGAYFFFGGLLMVLGSIGEWILGNTFPCVVFGSFGAFWFTYGAVLAPDFGSISNYEPYGGIEGTPFNAALGMFLVSMGALCVVYLILSVRTNIVFFAIFLCLVPAFGCLTGAFFNIANGDAASVAKAPTLLKAGGALAFVVCMLGWWIFMAIMLAALDFPFQLPVGDLSHIIKGASEKNK